MNRSVVVLAALLLPLTALAAGQDDQVQLARKLFDSGEYAQARDTLLKSDWKKDKDACLLLFHCERKLGNTKEATEYYKAAADADPSAKATNQAIEQKRDEIRNSAKDWSRKARVAQQHHREAMAVSRAAEAAARAKAVRELQSGARAVSRPG
ncbi:MAG: hypothetical protein AB1646_04845 [Thermodesulfobacteriota bacterium]